MSRFTVAHQAHFNVEILDPLAGYDMMDSTVADEVWDKRFAARPGLIAIRVQSEYTVIPIAVELGSSPCDPTEVDRWDYVVECPLEIKGRRVALESPERGEFASMDIGPPGRYRVRIYYGGQDTVLADGGTEDYYLIQIWPSMDAHTHIVKPLGDNKA